MLTPSERRRISFTVVGEGEPGFVESLIRLAVDLELTDVVHWVGPIYGPAAKADLMSGFNLGIFASTGENFGNAIVEMLGYGVPVLVCDKLPWADVGRVGCGFVVPRTIEAFAGALSEIIANPAELREMGQVGVAFSRSLPTWKDASTLLGRALEAAR
jgi:glycosyltransferase involved in cell wall biosynthesis